MSASRQEYKSFPQLDPFDPAAPVPQSRGGRGGRLALVGSVQRRVNVQRSADGNVSSPFFVLRPWPTVPPLCPFGALASAARSMPGLCWQPMTVVALIWRIGPATQTAKLRIQ